METLSNGRTLLNLIRQTLTNLGAQVAIYERDGHQTVPFLRSGELQVVRNHSFPDCIPG